MDDPSAPAEPSAQATDSTPNVVAIICIAIVAALVLALVGYVVFRPRLLPTDTTDATDPKRDTQTRTEPRPVKLGEDEGANDENPRTPSRLAASSKAKNEVPPSSPLDFLAIKVAKLLGCSTEPDGGRALV